MEVFDILEQVASTTKKNEKLAILEEHKGLGILKEVFYLAYAPTVNFYMKKVPDAHPCSLRPLPYGLGVLTGMLEQAVRGHKAIHLVRDTLQMLSPQDASIIVRILKGDMQCGVGANTLNKVWKGLIVKPPRMGAKSMNEKSLKALANKRKAIELKSDGSYLAFNRDLMSRNGNPVIVEPLELHLNCGAFEGYALEGEGIFDLTKATREEGNGIVGKIIKDTASNNEKDGLIYQIWDCIDVHHYKSKGKDATPNYERRLILESMMDNYHVFCNDQGLDPKVQLIPRTEDVTLEEADIIFEGYVRQGFEGAILKDMDAPWTDNGKPACSVKMKRKDPADLLVVGIYEGEEGGKAEGKLGGVNLESAEGRIKVNCGSGWSDDERELYWNNPNLILDKILEVEYDSITKDKKTQQESLFLPIKKKVRDDKLEADTYEEIKAKVRIK